MTSKAQFNYRRTGPTGEEVGASRVEQADKGPKSDLVTQLAKVEEHILQEAAVHFGGDVRRVPCPTRVQWSELARGRRPVLPSEGQMALYATDRMRGYAAKYGGLHKAYFAVALQRVLKRRAS